MDEGIPTNYNIRATFLDEFRIMFSTHDYNGAITELFLFDTLLPQDYPRNLRRVHLPPTYYRVPSTITLPDTPRGVLSWHEPLIVDPAQAIHIVKIFRADSCRHTILAFRIQALIEKARSEEHTSELQSRP